MNGHLGPNMHFTAATSSSPSTALDSLRQFQYLLRQPLYIEIAYTVQYNINQGSTPLVHCYWSQAQTQFLWSQGYSSLLRKDKTFASSLYVWKVLGSEELLGLENRFGNSIFSSRSQNPMNERVPKNEVLNRNGKYGTACCRMLCGA